MLSRFGSVGLLSACVLMALPGCGGAASDMPDIGQVTGKVTINGQPAANLMVTFQPQGGRPSYATTDEAGAYELTYNGDTKGTKLGSNLVTISTAEGEEDYGDGGSTKEVSLENADAIPAKYNTLASTNDEMTVDVKSGVNEFDWDVKSK